MTKFFLFIKVLFFTSLSFCLLAVVSGYIPVPIDQQLLQSAAHEWALVRGRPVTPRVSYAPCTVGALACYHYGDKTISMTLGCYMFRCNKKAVLMHEIGHSLGLEHIPHDLMDKYYYGQPPVVTSEDEWRLAILDALK